MDGYLSNKKLVIIIIPLGPCFSVWKIGSKHAACGQSKQAREK